MNKVSIIQSRNLSYYYLFRAIQKDMFTRMQQKVISIKKADSLVQSMRQKQNQAHLKSKNNKIKEAEMINSSEQQKPKSIASQSSAFWPFTESVQNNHFLHHIVYDDKSGISQSGAKKQNFTDDPTDKVFKALSKKYGHKNFYVGQIVLSKCQGEPLWPSKITLIEHIPGLTPSQTLYHVKFINQNNTSLFFSHQMIRMTSQAVQLLRSVSEDKKLLKSLKMAEKLAQKQKIQLEVSQTQTESPKKIQQSQKISNEQSNKQKSVVQNIEISKEGFYGLRNRNIMKPKQIQKTSEVIQDKKEQTIKSQTSQSEVPEKQESEDKILRFQPIVLIKGDEFQINLQGMKQLHQNQHKQCEITKKRRLRQKKNKATEISQINPSKYDPKPINLVVQTPKLTSKYYINKIVLKFSQLDDFSKTDQSNQQTNPNNQTIYEEAPQVNIRANTKKIRIKKDQNMPTIQEAEKYLIEYNDDLDRVRQISCKQLKQTQIIVFLSKPVNLLLIKQNYCIYNKLLKLCLEVIQKSEAEHSNEIFCLNLKDKLKLIDSTLQNYKGKNKYVKFLAKLNGKRLNDFFTTEQKKNSEVNKNEKLLQSLENQESEYLVIPIKENKKVQCQKVK